MEDRLESRKRTLGAMTHTCIRMVGNLTCRFKTDKAHLRYKRLATHEGNFYVDTLFSKVKLVQGFTCGNLYTTTLGFKKFFPMESKTGQECSNSLLIGIPPSLQSDNVLSSFRESSRRSAESSIFIKRQRNPTHHGKIGQKQESGKSSPMHQSLWSDTRRRCNCGASRTNMLQKYFP